jgi:hypothetical protein
MSALVFSQKFAISLAKLTLTAKKEFEAYLINSLDCLLTNKIFVFFKSGA